MGTTVVTQLVKETLIVHLDWIPAPNLGDGRLCKWTVHSKGTGIIISTCVCEVQSSRLDRSNYQICLVGQIEGH